MAITNPYADLTPRWQLPLLFVGQAQKELTLNEVAARLDSLVHCAVEGTLGSPPLAPLDGQAWLVGNPAAGAWEGCPDHLACWQGGGWIMVAPHRGMLVFDRQLGVYRNFRESWSVQQVQIPPTGGTVVDIQARAAIQALITALQSAAVIPLPS